MGGRRPGTVCGSTAEPLDSGTQCRQTSRAKGVLGKPTSPIPPKPSLNFAQLWAAYPSKKPYLDAKTGEPPTGYSNQCAIKVSVALMGAGVDLSKFRGAQVLVNKAKVAVRATELADWLKRQHIKGLADKPLNITGADWEDKISGQTGIVYFADYWLREGEKQPSGDHIDLWNGSRLTASGFEGALVTMARFGLGISSGPGFSDLGKSKTILFWAVP